MSTQGPPIALAFDKTLFAVSDPGEDKDQNLGQEWNMTKASPLQTNSEASYFSYLHWLPPISSVHRGQLCLNTQKENIKF